MRGRRNCTRKILAVASTLRSLGFNRAAPLHPIGKVHHGAELALIQSKNLIAGGNPMEPMHTKLLDMEEQPKNFIARHDARMLAVERPVVGGRGGPGPGDGRSEAKAPLDHLGRPILGPEHKMIHNLPALPNGEQRKPLNFAKWLRGVTTGHWDHAVEERKTLTETRCRWMG